jgi:predicted nucleic acid-binding Zn ribbon protein
MSEDAIKVCPECGKEVRRLIFGGSGIIFKGSGFYVNDSRGKNPAAPATASKPTGAGSDASSSGDKPGGESSGGSEQKKAPASAPSGTANPAGSNAAGKTSSKD